MLGHAVVPASMVKEDHTLFKMILVDFWSYCEVSKKRKWVNYMCVFLHYVHMIQVKTSLWLIVTILILCNHFLKDNNSIIIIK